MFTSPRRRCEVKRSRAPKSRSPYNDAMDNVNADSDANTGTKRDEPCMHNQSWNLRLYPSDAQKRGPAQWFGHARWLGMPD